MRKFFVLALVLGFLFAGNPVFAQGNVAIDFFYSETCPHCIAEQGFLDDLQTTYPELEINRYPVSSEQNVAAMRERLKAIGAERYFGSVPLTFVGSDFFLGFDNEDGIGADIIESVERQALITGSSGVVKEKQDEPGIRVPIIGRVDPSKYSLPALAVILGTLDGFNVCSLGALVLILGMALMLRSRRKIALYGGAFVLTTAVVYGALIFAWYGLFSILSQYIGLVQALVGAIGLLGGIYFLKEYRKMKRFGVTCDSNGLPIIGRLSQRMQKIFENGGNAASLVLGVLLFAAAITIIEFPCSAAVPVFFAGALAEASLSPIVFSSYIALFVFFYLLDELIVFGVAVYRLSIWLASPKFVKGITLTEGIVLTSIGLFYLIRTFL